MTIVLITIIIYLKPDCRVLSIANIVKFKKFNDVDDSSRTRSDRNIIILVVTFHYLL